MNEPFNKVEHDLFTVVIAGTDKHGAEYEGYYDSSGTENYPRLSRRPNSAKYWAEEKDALRVAKKVAGRGWVQTWGNLDWEHLTPVSVIYEDDVMPSLDITGARVVTVHHTWELKDDQ
jgi:hypothetical protein